MCGSTPRSPRHRHGWSTCSGTPDGHPAAHAPSMSVYVLTRARRSPTQFTRLMGRHPRPARLALPRRRSRRRRRPLAAPTHTSACSATIKNGCLFVYTPNTPFDVTEPGDPHGYTKFRAYAVLEPRRRLEGRGPAPRRRDDQRQRRRPAARSRPRSPDSGRRQTNLTHIHRFARARRVSPYATLGCVLRRATGCIEPHVVLPPTIGGYASVNLYTDISRRIRARQRTLPTRPASAAVVLPRRQGQRSRRRPPQHRLR